jgi:hypothetical protein
MNYKIYGTFSRDYGAKNLIKCFDGIPTSVENSKSTINPQDTAQTNTPKSKVPDIQPTPVEPDSSIATPSQN